MREQYPHTKMIKKQKILGNVGTLFYLILIGAFPPLSTDLYLPALPQLADHLQTSQTQVNHTLSWFFVVYASGLLFWGPLSEKYGRKKILFIGVFIYVFASILCALSQNILQLTASRILQAFGGSSATVVSMAIIKDMFFGRQRERIMAIMMSLVTIAPIVAPVLGAVLLDYASWRACFIVLAVIGIIVLVLTSLFEETLEERYEGSILSSWGRLLVVLKNTGFTYLLLTFSTLPMALMAFLAASPFIYISGFGLSEKTFSYFLAFNALVGMIGPMLYMKLSVYYEPRTLVTAGFAAMVISGIGVINLGSVSPWSFAFFVSIATTSIVFMRVPGANFMLEQQEKDTGSASGLINFFGMLMGSVGMFVIFFRPDTLITNLGVMQLAIGILSCTLWLLLGIRFVKTT